MKAFRVLLRERWRRQKSRQASDILNNFRCRHFQMVTKNLNKALVHNNLLNCWLFIREIWGWVSSTENSLNSFFSCLQMQHSLIFLLVSIPTSSSLSPYGNWLSSGFPSTAMYAKIFMKHPFTDKARRKRPKNKEVYATCERISLTKTWCLESLLAFFFLGSHWV